MKKYIAIIMILNAINFNCNATSCVETTTNQSNFEKNIDTIGDSLTWQGDGQYLRCLMRDYGLAYDFIGNHSDKFSFLHDGEGGNTTQQVIQRLNSIPVADNYFVLIGINDVLQGVPLQTTLNNIKKISSALHQKNKFARIYISTLLPIIYHQNLEVQKLNALLLNANTLCDTCEVIDVGGQFYQLENWQSYLIEGIHPNLKGYNALAKIIVSYIK